MTASAAAVNASVRNEKKNTSPGPALFRSGKRTERRRKHRKRMPYSALFPARAPGAGRLYKVAGAASRSSSAGRSDAGRGARSLAEAEDLLPPGPGRQKARRGPHGGRPSARLPAAAAGRARGLGMERAAVSGL